MALQAEQIAQGALVDHTPVAQRVELRGQITHHLANIAGFGGSIEHFAITRIIRRQYLTHCCPRSKCRIICSDFES